MKEPKKESKFVRTKIAAGYLILIAVCILAVGRVYRTVVRLSAPDPSLAQLQTKRSAVSRTLYHLYQAESYGQLAIAGYNSYQARYKRELKTVRACIDSLRALAVPGDSLQTMRLDSIEWLLADKQRRTMNLQRTIRSGGTASVLDRNIRGLIEPHADTAALDSLPAGRVVRQDTLVVPRRKRRFFRRVADLFSPPKTDSSVVISRREVVGTLPPAAVQDTIAAVLLALQDSVMSGRQGIYDEAWREGQRLRYSNELVNTAIYRLIRDFEAENTAYVLERIDRAERIRRRSSRMLGGIAIGAVVLMLLFVAVLWRDISRSTRYRRELERANRDNEALLAAREQLMLAITHDIKAPLGSVMGYIDLLSRLTEDRRQELYLRNMRESSEHLLALVDSLLDFYRLDINKVEVHNVSFTPGDLFDSIAAGFAAPAAAKGLAFRLEVSPGARSEAVGDVLRIRQIAGNLISNALKFTDAGSVTVRVDLAGGELVFSVADTGRGIGPEERERIFGEFVRLPSAQGVGGFGLGLSIVDRLVRLLGGTISLESTPGRGSKFIVWLPVGGDAVEEEVSEKVAPGLRALLVDDDPLQLEMAAAMCRGAGVAAECCQYPEYVVKLVDEGRFDVVLTDLQMPSSDGFGVLEAVHGVAPVLPVVAVTARSGIDDAALEAQGFAACLRKPFTFGELAAVLRKVCGGTSAPDRNPATAPTVVDPVAAGPVGAEPAPDFGALTAYAGDDDQAARSILRSFAGQTAANCAAFEQALDADDAAAVRALAHKMLPIFTMLGAEGVAGTLRRAENGEGALSAELSAELRAAAEKIRTIIAEAQKKISL